MPLDATTTRPGPSSSPKTPAAEGLRGVTIADSSVSLVDGVNGRLLFRGYDIPDLAKFSTFEETAFLLLHGRLPKAAELSAFEKALAAERTLPPAVLELLQQLPKDVDAMDALRTAVSLLGVLDPDARDPSPQALDRVAVRLIARVATVVAAFHRIRTGQPIVAPQSKGSHAHSLLRMVYGRDPDEFQEHAMDVALILHADHEFNASTFSARVTISTLSDAYSAITSAIGTLKGPLHGGANLAVMRHLEQIPSKDKVESWATTRLDKHEKIMGFGHAVYKTMDPRATVLKRLSEEAGKRYGETKWFELSTALQDVVYRKKGLYPNVDFYSASLYRVLGLPPDLFPPIFAVSRISGWMAHVKEQLEANKLIRPLSNYVGPAVRPYVPREART